MPLSPPPATAAASPAAITLPAGTQLWRVHRTYRQVTDFSNDRSDEVFGGGRFDSTDSEPYPFLYAAFDEETAVLETLARGLPFNQHGYRWLRRRAVAQYQISGLLVERDLMLVSLVSHEALAAACQDEWLIQAGPAEYPQTRRWGHWLRRQAQWAHGIRWPSARHLGHHSVVLFGDRCPDGALAAKPGETVVLDDHAGADWLNRRLHRYRIRIRPPRLSAAAG